MTVTTDLPVGAVTGLEMDGEQTLATPLEATAEAGETLTPHAN